MRCAALHYLSEGEQREMELFLYFHVPTWLLSLTKICSELSVVSPGSPSTVMTWPGRFHSVYYGKGIKMCQRSELENE